LEIKKSGKNPKKRISAAALWRMNNFYTEKAQYACQKRDGSAPLGGEKLHSREGTGGHRISRKKRRRESLGKRGKGKGPDVISVKGRKSAGVRVARGGLRES